MLIMLGWLEQQGFAEASLHASDFGTHLYEQLGFRPTNELSLPLPRNASSDRHACYSPTSPARTQSVEAREFTVRNAGTCDMALIQRCLVAAFERFKTLYTPEAFADTVPTPSGLQERLATICLFVAEYEERVIGTIGCNKLNAEEGHLRGMAVLPDWQGSPVAAALLAAAEAEMRRQGCTRLTLDTTEPLLRAMRFYEKHGFRRSGRVADFFGMRLHEYVKQL